MNVLAASLMFTARKDRSIFPHDCHDDQGNDCWPYVMAAAAFLSGWLSDARTQKDLDEAIEHFLTLLNARIVKKKTWKRQISWVIEQVMEVDAMSDEQLEKLHAELAEQYDDDENLLISLDEKINQEVEEFLFRENFSQN